MDDLAGNRWFARQPAAVRAALRDAGRRRALDAGQWLHGEGDEATGLVLVVGGMLRLETAVGDRHVLVGVARTGSAFGQSQRGGGGPRLVTARAGPPSRVVTVGDMALERIAAALPELRRAMNELVYAQLDASVQTLAQTIALPPRARIAARLMLFADTGEVSLTQSDLAEWCGLSRMAANAHLAALEAAGAITRGYGTIRLREVEILAAASG